MIPLLAIAGPTAVGKTSLAVEAALRLNGEIISADSMQVYRHLDIGTAKPSREEREKVPHHLLDLVDPGDEYNVNRYQKDAMNAIREVAARGKLPLLVGGTGLYYNAVVYDYQFTSMERVPEIRERLAEEAKIRGPGTLHQRLQELDPESAAGIHPHDIRRIIRALEVFFATGRPIHRQVAATASRPSCYQILAFGLTRPREALYRRIEERVDKMMREGLLEEAENLLGLGYSPYLKPLQGLGYKHMILYLTGKASLKDAVQLLKRDTRRYAKRQLTWFMKNREILWVQMEDETCGEENRALENICRLAAGEFSPGLE